MEANFLSRKALRHRIVRVHERKDTFFSSILLSAIFLSLEFFKIDCAYILHLLNCESYLRLRDLPALRIPLFDVL